MHPCAKAGLLEQQGSHKAVNPDQLLFGINQGCTYKDLRVEHMKQIAEYDLDGYAIGGLAVGEPAEVMYDVISAVEPYAPADKIRWCSLRYRCMAGLKASLNLPLR